MVHPDLVIIRLYRDRPGDLDIGDVVMPFAEAKEIAADRLIASLDEDQSGEAPRTADILGPDGSLLVRFVRRTRGVERVNVPFERDCPVAA